ncbi:hypothetical protein ES707_10070 [subsurface metagenome]
MSFTFKLLLDEGWAVAGYGPIAEKNHPMSVIKRRIQTHNEKGRIVKCFTDPENNNFMVAHRTKNLRDYFS